MQFTIRHPLVLFIASLALEETYLLPEASEAARGGGDIAHRNESDQFLWNKSVLVPETIELILKRFYMECYPTLHAILLKFPNIFVYDSSILKAAILKAAIFKAAILKNIIVTRQPVNYHLRFGLRRPIRLQEML